jgi:hypothetical protein
MSQASAPSNFEIAQAIDLLLGKHESFKLRVVSISSANIAEFPRFNAKFLYLSFRDGLPTIDEFIDYLKHQMVPYCLPRTERAQIEQQITTSPDKLYRLVGGAVEKARDLFIRAKKQQKTAGEPGELILYVLLEWAMHAPQIVSKMYLKTSAKMPVHGTDGIHIALDKDGKTLLLYFGESKLHAGLSGGMTAVFDSVSKFVDDKKKYAREIDIVRDHMHLEHGPLRDALLEYFDPYSAKSAERKEIFACFLGFDSEQYTALSHLPPKEIEAAFQDLFKKKIDEVISLFKKRLSIKPRETFNFQFFVVPFPSIEEFRKAFFKATGLDHAS